MIFFEILYVLSAAILAVYGYNTLILAWLRVWRYSPNPVKMASPGFEWPQVTVQLPIYNERYVVNRLIDSIVQLNYPRDRLEIQVLDDSTDDTVQIVSQTVARQRARGFDITHIRRANRQGFKGGALEHGLDDAKGEFIAIFDADFLPPPGFLEKMIPNFADSPDIGCLQARWGHINQESSWLTRAQATGIDGHFIIEQETRSEKGVFLNFNGTAGIWRRACIEDAGGWHHDTLTEDLDLSYRAQLRGWRIRYLPHISAPAELPAHINAYKRQQFRWAKGSIQTAIKTLGALWRSPNPTAVKIEGTIHLTNYAVHPLMLLNLILTLPLMVNRSLLLWMIPIFTFAAIGPWFMYWIAMREQGRGYQERFSNLVMLVFLGAGLSLNNTRAVGEALLGKQSSFLRTPKFDLRGRKKQEQSSSYLLPRDANVWIESLLALYAALLFVYAVTAGLWSIVPWLLMYVGGFSYVSGLNIIQSRQNTLKNTSLRVNNIKLVSHQQTAQQIQQKPESITLD